MIAQFKITIIGQEAVQSEDSQNKGSWVQIAALYVTGILDGNFKLYKVSTVNDAVQKGCFCYF